MKDSEYPYRVTLYKSDICVIKDAPSDVFGVVAFLKDLTQLHWDELTPLINQLRTKGACAYTSLPDDPTNYMVSVTKHKKRWYRRR